MQENNGHASFSTNEIPLTMDEMEKRHILAALRHTGGMVAGPNGAAALLGMQRGTLQHRMKKLGIVRKKRLYGKI